MPPRFKPPLALPDFRIVTSAKDNACLTAAEAQVQDLVRQSNERLIQEHLRELKRRIHAAITALPADLHQFHIWRRVRFDGIHIEAEWSATPNCYYWLEPAGRDRGGPFNHMIDCSERPPPMGWSRWIYFEEPVPHTKYLRVEWNIREGEMQWFFEYWRNESLMEKIEAADAIEECRAGSKRLTKEERSASPLQLCLAWNLEQKVRDRQEAQQKLDWFFVTPTRHLCFQGFEALRFSDDGRQIVPPLRISPGDMILLSKHEISVLSKHPHLKRFIFANYDDPGWADILDHRREARIQERRSQKPWAQRDDPDPEDDAVIVAADFDARYNQLSSSDLLRTEIERVDLPSVDSGVSSSSLPMGPAVVRVRRRRLDESLVTEASSHGEVSSAAQDTMEED